MGNQTMQGKGDRHVDIKTELAGRCSDVLLMLGINPLAMASQITCPIDAHQPRWPSFRVNPVTNRYYCSVCEPKGASFVDLVIKMNRASNFKEACQYLRLGLGLLTQHEPSAPHQPLEHMCDMPDPIAALGIESLFDDAEVGNEAHHPDRCDDEDELNELLKDSKEASWSQYTSVLKIAPLGAMALPGGSLAVPVRSNMGYLYGVLEIAPNGLRTVHNRKNLNGAATVLGELNGSEILAFVRDWESQVAIHNFSGGRCTIAYHEPTNMMDAVQDFVGENVKEIWLFKCDKDDDQEVNRLKDWTQSQAINLQILDTKNEALIERYRKAVSGKQVSKSQ